VGGPPASAKKIAFPAKAPPRASNMIGKSGCPPNKLLIPDWTTDGVTTAEHAVEFTQATSGAFCAAFRS
jgi:hypothetical protein